MSNVKVVIIISQSIEVLNKSWEINWRQALEKENTLIEK
jgi:hypothetical protein